MAAEREDLMADLQDVLLKVLRELGPDASDDEIGKKMGEYIEALSDSDRAEVMEQMIGLTTSTQLAHLRELAETEPVDTDPTDPPISREPSTPEEVEESSEAEKDKEAEAWQEDEAW
jgi:hypothetical protein